jgi:hypothetical protein
MSADGAVVHQAGDLSLAANPNRRARIYGQTVKLSSAPFRM